eukprot:TRINITY_DN33305_c0_g1_i1.p1 TRINITY_DN33305_c0_g1~~TRINITY_DN33305_c0_g1_i1.p1  ORF type:complete len:377 (-),score=53.43 TRINITY_DN33305_c0_g1_i1:228-1190(-)
MANPLDISSAPIVSPVLEQELEQLIKFVRDNKSVAVLTGAGVSTESNIPDYRGPNGAYTTGFKPMTHQEFISSESKRQRYWSRSYVGWPKFSNVQPNDAHISLARLQENSWINSIMTQNVDRLHQKGGAKNVLELHGTTHEVVCLGCKDIDDREQFQKTMTKLNPQLAGLVNNLNNGSRERKLQIDRKGEDVRMPVQRPDGDVELVDAGVGLVIPPCQNCGSLDLKPNVVFFGDSVPVEAVEAAKKAVVDNQALLVLGSSLMVYSAFRLVKLAQQLGKKIAVVNVGDTRADDIVDFKVQARVGEVLSRMARHPSLLLPRT